MLWLLSIVSIPAVALVVATVWCMIPERHAGVPLRRGLYPDADPTR